MDKVIAIKDDRYPNLLKKINSPPERIYYKGDWDFDIFENCLAVVGSRRMTTYGKDITYHLVSQIAASGITIVSGFMFGIDAEAHKAALSSGGRTIAVMPCGINVIHPSYQEDLYRDIIKEKGLIVSEFEGNFPPNVWTYPRRNRIVAGLSMAVMVVEAAEKSGSLITADLSKKFERKIFAVPGPLGRKTSEGTNRLIKEGAEIVTEAKDIINYFGLSSLENKKKRMDNKKLGLNELEKNILKEIEIEPLGADDLSRIIKKPVSEVGTSLSIMQVKGLIFEREGKYHSRI